MFKKLYEPVETVRLTIDGVETTAEAGETVAAVLLRTEPYYTRTSPVGGGRRAPYCMMGVCFECLAMVDGVSSVQTCLTLVHDGMKVERQIAGGQLSS